MDTLRSAHEVILNRIATHCRNLKEIDKAIAEGGVRTGGGGCISKSELQTGRSQEIGGLCSLLEVLEGMVIPENKLPGVIEELRKLPSNHLAISSTIQKLSERIAIPPSSSVSVASSESTT